MSGIDALSGIKLASAKGISATENTQGVEENALGFTALFNGLITQLCDQGDNPDKGADTFLGKEDVSDILSNIERQFAFAQQEGLASLFQESQDLAGKDHSKHLAEGVLSSITFRDKSLDNNIKLLEVLEKIHSFQDNLVTSNNSNTTVGQGANDNVLNLQTSGSQSELITKTITNSDNPSLGESGSQSELITKTISDIEHTYRNNIANYLQNLKGEIEKNSQIENTTGARVDVQVQRMNSGLFNGLDYGEGYQNGLKNAADMPLQQNSPTESSSENGKISTDILFNQKVQKAHGDQIGDFQGQSDTNSQGSGKENLGIYFDRQGAQGLVQVQEMTQNFSKLVDKANPGPIGEQIANNIFEKAFNTRPQVRELNIQLHPEELGQIRIHLTWEEGQVHLRMIAAEQSTSQIIQSSFPELRDNLSQLGIQCGSMEMGLGEEGQESHQQESESTHHSSNEEAEEYTDVQNLLDLLDPEELEELKSGSKDSNTINVTA